jgi:hypothetical protein
MWRAAASRAALAAMYMASSAAATSSQLVQNWRRKCLCAGMNQYHLPIPRAVVWSISSVRALGATLMLWIQPRTRATCCKIFCSYRAAGIYTHCTSSLIRREVWLISSVFSLCEMCVDIWSQSFRLLLRWQCVLAM